MNNNNLKKTLNKVSSDFNKENIFDALYEMTVSIASDAEVFAPVVDSDPENMFGVTKDSDGYLWLLFFTDENEYLEMSDTNVVKRVSIRSLFEKACTDKDIYGIVVNPFSDHLTINRALFEFILKNADTVFCD